MGAIASAFNYKAQKRANEINLQLGRETNELNRELAEKQNAWNRQMWEDTNVYNSPQNQVQRLQDAGLSAAAAAQAASGIPATPMESAQLANQQIPPSQVAPQIDFDASSLITIARQLEALKSDKLGNQMKEQDAAVHNRIILSEADAKEWMVDRMEQQFHQSAAMFPYSIAGMTADAWYKQKMSDYYTEMGKKIEADTARVKQDFEFLKDFNELKKKECAEQIKNILAERKKIQQETATSKSQQDLNVALKGSAESQKTSQDLQNTLTKFGFPDSVAMRSAAMMADGQITDEQFWKYLEKIGFYATSGNRYLDDPETRNFLHYIYDEGRASRGEKSPHQLAPWQDSVESFLRIFR